MGDRIVNHWTTLCWTFYTKEKHRNLRDNEDTYYTVKTRIWKRKKEKNVDLYGNYFELMDILDYDLNRALEIESLKRMAIILRIYTILANFEWF